MAFHKAERKKAKLRLGFSGASGSGKTFSALLVAFGLGGKVALIDTENKSGELYAHLGEYSCQQIEAPFTPDKYIKAIKEAEAEGFDVIIIDSLSHAWAGEGGLLDMQGKIADSGKGNSYTAWRTVTPKHNRLVEAMLQSKCHIIATMRAKTEYVLEKNSKGQDAPRKVGMAPIQRDGMEYEFTVCFDIDKNHNVTTSKDRTSLFDGRIFLPSKDLGKELLAWLNTGKDPGPPLPSPAEKTADAAVSSKVAEPNISQAVLDETHRAEAAEAEAPPEGEPFPVDKITDDQKKKIMACFNDLGIKNRDSRLSWVRTCLHQPAIQSVNDLDKQMASKLIGALEDTIAVNKAEKESA